MIQQCRRPGFDPWVGKRRHGNPLRYSCLENPHGQRRLAGYSPWGHKESDMTVTKHSTGVPKILLQAVNASWLGPRSMFLNYCFPMVLWSTLCDTFSFTFGYIWKDHQRIGPFKNLNSAPAYIKLESPCSCHCSVLKQGWCTFVNTAFWNSPLSFYKKSLSLISQSHMPNVTFIIILGACFSLYRHKCKSFYCIFLQWGWLYS